MSCRLVFVKPEKDNDTICLKNTISGAVIREKYIEQSRPKLVGKTEDYISVFWIRQSVGTDMSKMTLQIYEMPRVSF